MRGFKLLGMGAVAGVVMMLAVLPVSGAFAGKVLQLTVNGKPVSDGSAAHTLFALGSCTVFEEGNVAVNGSAKDVLKNTGLEFFECEGGASESGLITELVLQDSGKIKTAGIVSVTKPGPCVYEFKTFKGTFEVPGQIIVSGTTKGKLNKTASNKTKKACATKVEEPYVIVGAEGEDNPLSDEL